MKVYILTIRKYQKMALIFYKRNITKVFLLILSLSFHKNLYSFELHPYEAKYQATKYGIKATGKRTLEVIEKNKYRLTMKVDFLWFSFIESSEFIITEDFNVQSLNYLYKSKGSKNKKNIIMTFDLKNSTLTKDINGTLTNHKISDITYDKLSYQIQMRIDLFKEPSIRSLNYLVADHDKTRKYLFSNKNKIKNELIDQTSVIFERNEKNKTTRIWFSIDQDFIPEKFYLKKGDEEQIIYLKDLRYF